MAHLLGLGKNVSQIPFPASGFLAMLGIPVVAPPGAAAHQPTKSSRRRRLVSTMPNSSTVPKSSVPKYFMYFPGNYRWSAAYVNMLGRGSFGGADISELHKIGRLLEGKDPEDDDAWFDACVTIGDEVRAHAERFRASNHPISAAGFY